MVHVTTRWYNPSEYLELVICVCSMITTQHAISKVKHAISLRLGGSRIDIHVSIKLNSLCKIQITSLHNIVSCLAPSTQKAEGWARDYTQYTFGNASSCSVHVAATWEKCTLVSSPDPLPWKVFNVAVCNTENLGMDLGMKLVHTCLARFKHPLMVIFW